MLDLLQNLLNLAVELGMSLWGLLMLLLSFSAETLNLLHTEMPRLEGLLAGVLLAWLMARRNKHPLLRALSAPLKLVLDILDLAWDQCVEVLQDVLGTAKGWIKGSLGWVRNKVVGVYNWSMNLLKGLLSKLKKKSK